MFRKSRADFIGIVSVLTAWAGFTPLRAEAETPAAAEATVVDSIIVTGRAAKPDAGISVTGANDYGATAADIAALPQGAAAPLTDVLLRLPGVSLDQNQQIHIRDTEGPQFQYQINGILVPFDINTNPPFLSMINPMFIKRLDLIDGVLPSRYSYATGGVVDIQTKDGCEQTGGEASVLVGQRGTFKPSVQYGGCAGKVGYYVSALYGQSDTAFSSATPGPNPVHDFGRQGQIFGVFSDAVSAKTQLGLIISLSASDNQLPNIPGLTPQYTLAGVPNYPSAIINSALNFRDELAIVSIRTEPTTEITTQLAYTIHAISERFLPDDPGELIFQGVASRATHDDFDNTLQGDIAWTSGRHTLSAGFYAGAYNVRAVDNSLVFPVDGNGEQTSETPVAVASAARATNVVLGLYVEDLWKITDDLRVDLGLRADSLTGFTHHRQIDPSVNFAWSPDPATTLHAGFARYMQVPSFSGVSPDAQAAFAGTTAASPPGAPNPLAEDDYEWDAGIVRHVTRSLTVTADGYYEITDHYLDTGQFGVVPIFAPFNYGHGDMWGVELAARYATGPLSAYANVTISQNRQTGVATGQFNFDATELAYIDSHSIVLDHAPLAGLTGGVTYAWRGWSASLDGIYSSGLRGGFADTERLPQVIQLNASVGRSWHVAGLGMVSNRLSILNLTDRVNLIRPAEGIGIFQAAYGPRLTVLDSVSLAF